VCVLGLGYIGLPTASILGHRGFRVYGVDVVADVVDKINQGKTHIHEPHLDELVSQVVREGKLTASSEPQAADVFIICVPTPVTADRAPDVSFVEQAAKAIRPHVQKGNLVILESTSPPGTTNTVILGEAIPDDFVVGEDVFVAYCPERVLPGRILIEAVENDRIVGGVTERCAEQAKAFYESFVTGKVWSTDTVTAEMVKLVENAYRDVNIAFANELSVLAEQVEADPFEIIKLANKHPRVNILTPGPGVGGHCIGVDPWFLIHGAPELTPLMRAARTVNDAKPLHVVDQVVRLVQQHNCKTIGCLGLTYKADVDDLRESPSLDIVRQLQALKIANVLACDPYVPPSRLQDVMIKDLDDVVRHSDVLVLLTDHRQFQTIPTEVLRKKLLVDTRGFWRNITFRDSGAETLSGVTKKTLRSSAA
jgi:UDP-N-acetyl-D-mannosaminuronic acid dehydrogenase